MRDKKEVKLSVKTASSIVILIAIVNDKYEKLKSVFQKNDLKFHVQRFTLLISRVVMSAICFIEKVTGQRPLYCLTPRPKVIFSMTTSKINYEFEGTPCNCRVFKIFIRDPKTNKIIIRQRQTYYPAT